MTENLDQRFLEDIIQNPDDDGLRLIYADWLSDYAYEPGNEQVRDSTEAKSEFIRVQVALDSGKENSEPLTDIRRTELEERQNQLLEQHQTVWEEPLRTLGAREITFRRGLPEGVTISAANLISNAAKLFAIAPIKAMKVENATPGQIESLAASPHLEKLTHLNLWSNYIGSEGARALAESPNLTSLTHLNLGYNIIGDAGVRALATSPHLRSLTHLNLWGNVIRNAGALALAQSPNLENLTSLELRGNNIFDEGALALAESANLTNLTSLDLRSNYISDEGARSLARSPYLKNLTSLVLNHNDIGGAFMREIEREMTRRNQAKQR